MRSKFVLIAIMLSVKICHSGYARNGGILDNDIFMAEFDGNLRHTTCDGLLKPSILLKRFEIFPKKFFIPQNISMTIRFDLLKDLEPPIKVKLSILKSLGFMGYVKLPCIANYGSCSFSRICEIMETYPEDSFAYKVTCPKWFLQSGVECKCPIKKGGYGVADIRVPLESSIVPKWIAMGDYKATLIIEGGKRTAGCFQFQFRLT